MVKRLQRVAYIHQQDQAAQALALPEIIFKMLFPESLDLRWDLGKTVAGQVNQPLRVGEAEKIDQLGTARRFAGAGQLAVAGNRVDTTGLASVRPAGKRHLGPGIGRALGEFAGTGKELCKLKIGHGEVTTLLKKGG